MEKKAQRRIVGAWEHGVGRPDFTLRDSSNTEAYAHQLENDFLGAAQNPLSTFSIDVDTAGYANVRRFLNDGVRPPPSAVRIEELVNYFPYHYAVPVAKDVPFAASMEVASAPWAPTHRLVRIGLKGREVSAAQRGAANLVFLVDVSGSMNAPNRLPLVKESLRLLVGKLRPDDHVAIVVYAGASGLALPSTSVAKAKDILAAIDDLTPGGSTNGAMGIQLAYDIAKANFVTDGINRVILCTDGDFNVGVTSEGELTRLIEEKAKSKVFLTVLGYGRGNLKDSTMELLADKGNGNYGYIDSRREAEKLLGEQVNGTLVTIAKDVKLQVEFNPAQVASYRLIGYENRLLKKEDFNNDKVDAGEIGAGHTVTALYEVVPVGVSATDPALNGGEVDALKYRKPDTGNRMAQAGKNPVSGIADPVSKELLTLKVRYKEPTGDVSRKLEFALTDSGAKFEQASADFQFAAAVAEFGMILRGSSHKGTGSLKEVAAWARAATADDVGGYRGEFIGLVEKAEALQ
ncbi:MAG: VWA domain-containing protein [Verrucomicrobia bacterium]|nr:VWA domain-containing protein [Verrucomicrobiota bacterium]